MSQMEQAFQHGLFQSVHCDPAFLSRLASDPKALESLISYIGRNPHFYRIYLKKNIDLLTFEAFRRYWEEYIKPIFISCGVELESHMLYYYTSYKAGLLSVLRLWLENGCMESPKELSQILARMLPSKSSFHDAANDQ